jgi:hypothetical protein
VPAPARPGPAAAGSPLHSAPAASTPLNGTQVTTCLGAGDSTCPTPTITPSPATSPNWGQSLGRCANHSASRAETPTPPGHDRRLQRPITQPVRWANPRVSAGRRSCAESRASIGPDEQHGCKSARQAGNLNLACKHV